MELTGLTQLLEIHVRRSVDRDRKRTDLRALTYSRSTPNPCSLTRLFVQTKSSSSS